MIEHLQINQIQSLNNSEVNKQLNQTEPKIRWPILLCSISKYCINYLY